MPGSSRTRSDAASSSTPPTTTARSTRPPCARAATSCCRAGSSTAACSCCAGRTSHGRPGGGEVRLLEFLDRLCETRPELRIYILAWDFHVVFALEREWMQRLYFHWMTHERLLFRFDDCHAARRLPPPEVRGHRRPAVVPGRHRPVRGALGRPPPPAPTTRSRLSRGRPQKPYHDVQAYLAGGRVGRGAGASCSASAGSAAGGDPLAPAPPRCRARGGPAPAAPRGALPLPGAGRWRSAAPIRAGRRASRSREVEHAARRRHRRRRAADLHRDAVLQQPAHLRGARGAHARPARPAASRS